MCNFVSDGKVVSKIRRCPQGDGIRQLKATQDRPFLKSTAIGHFEGLRTKRPVTVFHESLEFLPEKTIVKSTPSALNHFGLKFQ